MSSVSWVSGGDCGPQTVRTVWRDWNKRSCIDTNSRAVRQAKQIHTKKVVWDIDMIQEASKCHPVKVLGWGNGH